MKRNAFHFYLSTKKTKMPNFKENLKLFILPLMGLVFFSCSKINKNLTNKNDQYFEGTIVYDLTNYYKIYDVLKVVGLNPNALPLQARILNAKLFKLIPFKIRHSLLNSIHRMLSRKILSVFSNEKKHAAFQA